MKNLIKAVSLCYHIDGKGNIVRGPSTTILTFKNLIRLESTFEERVKIIFEKIKNTHKNISFDQCVGQIISLDSYSLFKKRPNSEEYFNNQAEYIAFDNSKKDEYHFSLQFLLTSILSAYYHESRTNINRPGFTSFPTRRKHDLELGKIKVNRIR